MALTHSAPGARIACRPLAQDLRTTPTHALLKTGQIEHWLANFSAARELADVGLVGVGDLGSLACAEERGGGEERGEG